MPNLIHVLVEESVALQHLHMLPDLASHRIVVELFITSYLPIYCQHLLQSSQLVRTQYQLGLLHHNVCQQLVLQHPLVLIVTQRQVS